MGAIVSCVLGVGAAYLFWRSGVIIGMWFSLAATAVAFWSAGIMHNYALQQANARHQRFRQLRVNQGATADELTRLDSTPVRLSPEDIASVPNGITKLNMLGTLAVVVLVVWALLRSLT